MKYAMYHLRIISQYFPLKGVLYGLVGTYICFQHNKLLKSKIMKTTLKLLIVCLPLLFGACSKDNDDCDPQDAKSVCYAGDAVGEQLLLIEQRIDGELSARYGYNDHNMMISTHTYPGGEGLEFKYNDKGLLEAMTTTTDGVGLTTIRYFYENEDKPVGAEVLIGSEWQYDIHYSYADNKTIETASYGDVNTVSIYTYDKLGNFLTQEVLVNGERVTLIEQGSYDTQHAPGLHGNPFKWLLYSPNNPGFIKTTTSGSGSSDLVMKYTYNAAGYPVVVEEHDRSTGALVRTRTYSYRPPK